MPRPKAADFGAKQQLIRDRAAELFAARGFAGTSITDIAAACGVAKSLVYHYFGAKEDILHDLLADHVRRLIGAAEAALAPGGDARARFIAFTAAHLRLYVDARAKHKLLLNALGDLGATRREEIVRLQRRLVAMARALVIELDPRLADDGARATATAMSFYGVINWTHTWFRADGALSIEDYAALAGGLFLDGLTRCAAGTSRPRSAMPRAPGTRR